MILNQEFTQENEQSFLQSKEFIDPHYIRGIFSVLAILYSGFIFLDMYYYPDNMDHLLIIRFGIVVPLLLSVVGLTFTKHFYSFNQKLISLSFFAGGMGIVYMLLLKPSNIIYYGGLFMVYFAGYFLIRLRFIYASYAGAMIFMGYLMGQLLIYQEFTNTFLFSAVFIVSANVIGMHGAYYYEKMLRKQFLHNLNITEANELLIKQYEDKKSKLNELEKSIHENTILRTLNQEKDFLAASLLESETQYRLLTTQMQLGLAFHQMIFDDFGKPVDYRFISVNESFERLTGLKSENVIGRRVLEVLPQTESYWIETYGKVAQTGEPIEFENYSSELDKYFRVYAYAPNHGQFAIIMDDITSKKQQEITNEQRHKDLMTTQKIAKIGTWRLFLDTHEVEWTEELYHMFGLDPNDAPPPYTKHMKLFSPDSWDKLSKAVELTATQGIPYSLELEKVTVNGTKGWLWAFGDAEHDENGNIISITGAAQDITERKRLEEELYESNQKLYAIFDKSPVSIEFYDANGCHLYANEAALDLFGVLEPEKLKGSRLLDNPNLDRELLDRIENFETIKIEIDYDFEKVKQYNVYKTRKSGQIILSLSITPLIKNEKLSGYIIHTEDITVERQEQKHIEYLSYHDYMTDLYNRRYFVNAYNQNVAKEKYPIGVMMIDINGLKIINDAYGHAHGDMAIKRVAKLLLSVFSQNDVVARIGGDEFAIISPEKNALDMQAYKEKIIEKVVGNTVGNIEISLAIGYEVIYDKEKDIDDLLSEAENYLYRHKVTVGSSVRNHAIKAILNTLTDKYSEEKKHSEKVSFYCKRVGIELGLSTEETDLLELAGMYHDIGKISIPDAILNKPGKLTSEEYEIIKTHTLIGYQILKAADEYSGLAEYALSHHERWDGKGYPKGLKGEEIPLFSRIISVADSFEAMTADRPYRKGMSIEQAIEELKRCSGTQFDSRIVDIFIKHKVYEEEINIKEVA